MKTTVQYLDAVKRELGISSDYALAKHLELTKQAISQLQSGARGMSPTTAARVAVILGLDPLVVIADAELERGSDGALWKRLRDAAAAVLVAIGAALFPAPDAQARLNNNLFAVAGSPGGFPYEKPASVRRSDYTLHRLWRWLAAWWRS